MVRKDRMMGWNGTNIKPTWIRKQFRGVGRRRCIPDKWWCDACKKWHLPTTDRIKTTDDQTICFKEFVK